MIDILLLDPIKALIALVGALFVLDLLFRVIPTKKTISLLGLLSRGLAKSALLVGKLNKLLPENRRK